MLSTPLLYFILLYFTLLYSPFLSSSVPYCSTDTIEQILIDLSEDFVPEFVLSNDFLAYFETTAACYKGHMNLSNPVSLGY